MKRYREIKTGMHTLDRFGCYGVELEFFGWADGWPDPEDGPEAGEIFILSDGTTKRMALATSDSSYGEEFEAFLMDARYNKLGGI